MRSDAAGTSGTIRRVRGPRRYRPAEDAVVTMPLAHPTQVARRAAAGAVRERPGLRSFRILLAAFVLVAVTKVHEAIPQLGFIPFVKLAGLAMILSAFSVISAGPFRAMMQTPTARWVKIIV